MESMKDTLPYQYEISEKESGGITLHLQGRMDSTCASHMIEVLTSMLKDRLPTSLTVNLEKVTYLDDFGALVLLELKNLMAVGKGAFDIENASEEILFNLNFDSFEKRSPIPKKQSPGMIVRLGDATYNIASDLKYLVSFVGSVGLSLLYVCIHPKSLRVDDVFSCMQKTGVDALPIVGLISFLLGLIMAFMSAFQLAQFGASIYVASLVSMMMVLELGPIMTAIIVAGRSGSSFAAEIGTMKISEEIDALFTMGFDPTRFLVIPRVIASIIVVPFLTLFSDVFAISGGLLVGVFVLDLTAHAYISQTIKSLALFDVFWGFLKSAFFALLIAGIGCLRGFQVRGGAASVGQATTSAVVSSLFLIILFDSIFAVIHQYWS